MAPILIWPDRRTQPWTNWRSARLSQAKSYRITGLPLNYIYFTNKILWL